MTTEVVAKAAVVAGLDAEIQLGEDGPAELLDGGDRRQRRDRGDGVQHARADSHHGEIEGAKLDHVGTPDLDGDDATVRQARLVDLRHRGRGDGDGRELGKELAHGTAKIGLERSDDRLEGEGTDVVLEVLERARHVVGDEVGAGAHDLADLDEGGAQLAEKVEDHLAEEGLPPLLSGEGQQQDGPPDPPSKPVLGDAEANRQGAQREAASWQRLRGHAQNFILFII